MLMYCKKKSLYKYDILNKIKAGKFNNVFPYDNLSKDKLVFTRNKIDLLIKKPDNKVIGGSEKPIIIYH